MQVTLTIVEGSDKPRTIPLHGNEVVIGRAKGTGIRIAAHDVSRHHCRINVKDGQVFLRDLGSRNGTTVNGQAIKDEHRLFPSDCFQVGPLTFRIDFDPHGGPIEVLSLDADDAPIPMDPDLLGPGDAPVEIVVAEVVPQEQKTTPPQPTQKKERKVRVVKPKRVKHRAPPTQVALPEVEKLPPAAGKRAGATGTPSLPMAEPEEPEALPDDSGLLPAADVDEYFESDNIGTRQVSMQEADAYWAARTWAPVKEPFVLALFPTIAEAQAALLGVSCIQRAADTGRLICTRALVFGAYAVENGNYEAILCGNDMPRTLWQEARASFLRHGGRIRGELESQHDEPAPPASAQEGVSGVAFIRQETRPSPFGGSYTYHIYEGPNAASAKEFLRQNPVTDERFYLVVETPQGSFGRDINGIYEDPTAGSR